MRYFKPGEDPFDPARFDPKDPDPWMALYLDHSLPIDDGAKRDLLLGARSRSRRWLFPVARPLVPMARRLRPWTRWRRCPTATPWTPTR